MAAQEKIKTILLHESIFDDMKKDGDKLRKELSDKGIFLVNVMSSPGSGKTTTLIQVINRMKDKYKIAVMEADIDSDVDAVRIAEKTGVDSIQLHTGGMCHLDSDMTRQGLRNLKDNQYDLIFLENVGNLVCPAEFDTGANEDICILSISEGSDKPIKYPKMFEVCNLVVINKIDAIDYFDFDFAAVEEFIHQRNPKAEIIKISAKTGEGIDLLINHFDKELQNRRK